jgi:N-methylhydantoinase A
MSGMRLGVDVGGTFTDLVGVGEDGRIVTSKVPSSSPGGAEGVMAAIGATGIGPQAISALAHGTTVATNALLERRGARTALVTTQGFRDIIEIGRQNRASLYDLTRRHPPALVPRSLRFIVRERMGPDGPIEPLDERSVAAVVDRIEAANVEAVAVCLLFSYLHPEHERAVGAALRGALPDVHVSLSSEVLPEFREFERFSTTAADAYLGPRLSGYLVDLGAEVARAALPAPVVMRSSGGVVGVETAATSAAACVLSGPAGGVVGAAHVAESSGFENVLTLDMGGTSTDVAPVVGGRIATTTEAIVAGVPLKLPMVDVHTVSAGGGSIAWGDSGGALRVGPRSAGAEPGPAAYGRGGTDPTVTDAHVALGHLADGAELGGTIVLDRHAASSALTGLAGRLGMSVAEIAGGILRVADAEMARALRVISIERGLDPRDFALAAFGGAGPLHACSLAEELGMTTILVPRASGVLSAMGLAISDARRDLVAPCSDRSAADEAFRSLEDEVALELRSPQVRRRADLRYTGQSFELTVDADDLDHLDEAFIAEHHRRYGYTMPDGAIELVNVRVVATVPVPRPELVDDPADSDPRTGSRSIAGNGDQLEVPVFDRSLMGAGSRVRGPAIVEFPESTCLVDPGWEGEIDRTGTLVLRRGR